jgi:glucan phosphoethanolaminetransferase (alkaline phosphatase superfamily)
MVGEMLKVIEPVQNNLEMIFEWIILTLSIISVFLGFVGLLVVITTHKSETDALLQYAYVFVYSYMIVLGTLLMTYRKRILVKR